MTLTSQAASSFDPVKQSRHSQYVDSVKFFGKNGLERLAMFVNVMTRPEVSEPDLFELIIPSCSEEIYPAVEVKSQDGHTARFEPLAITGSLQWSSLQVTIDGVVAVHENLPNYNAEDEIFTKFNNWCMTHCPSGLEMEFDARWDGSIRDVQEVALNVQAAAQRRPN